MMLSRDSRVELIKQLEEERGSSVLVFFCGDRSIAPANIAGDSIRPLYDHLLALRSKYKKIDKLDLYLYSIGGRLEIPWRIATMLREFGKSISVIIPYKAYSAATLIALGADQILMGQKGELGPIDPSLSVVVPEGAPAPQLPPEIGVEDISSYISFVKERAGLTDQHALAQAVGILADKLTPPLLGQIERAHSHIRVVARKLLSLCQPPLEERRASAIVDALAEKIYLHGHGIGRIEAKEIGLQIQESNDRLEDLMWKLFLHYEDCLKLNTSADLLGYFPSDDVDDYREPETVIACIESTEGVHAFRGELRLKKLRKMPPQPTINVNLQLPLPPGLQPQAIPIGVQQAVQQLLQQGAASIRDQVISEIRRQSPIMRIDVRIIGGKWDKLA